ncbi:hypothetical protein LSTR_LSTR009074 [Laodelphax striatellus]|uniref:Uncharacterized protein n=1 Tax=Laodelphax striatellus TaxID=195883 RepID=A0A482XQ51_LAOST|nr:hypothetical protein LSTR_LSTR009074 [Laodelphax striatellus]
MGGRTGTRCFVSAVKTSIQQLALQDVSVVNVHTTNKTMSHILSSDQAFSRNEETNFLRTDQTLKTTLVNMPTAGYLQKRAITGTANHSKFEMYVPCYLVA